MGIASRLVYRLVSDAQGIGPLERLVLVGIALAASAFAAAALLAGDLLPPVSEPVIMAPFRWRSALM